MRRSRRASRSPRSRARLPRGHPRRPARDRLLADVRARSRAGVGRAPRRRTTINAFKLTADHHRYRRAREHGLRDRLRARDRPPALPRARALLNAFVDLPLALSPVVVGLALFLLYGRERLVRQLARRPRRSRCSSRCRRWSSRRSSSRSRSSRARSCRRCARSATSRSRPRATLGASGWQTFWRITLPSIRWAVIYGVILTTARCLGEYGAVAVVSGRLQGETETATAARPGALRDLRPRRRVRRSRSSLRCIAVLVLVAMTVDPTARRTRPDVDPRPQRLASASATSSPSTTSRSRCRAAR